MPIPQKGEKETTQDFLSRCMGDSTMNTEYPDKSQRYAVCMKSVKASYMDSIEYAHYDETYGNTEEINENNFYIPEDEEYLSLASCDCDCDDEEDEEDEEEYDLAKDKPGLWENIRKKKERMGDNYRPAKPGDKDRPDPKSFKKSQAKENTKIKLNKPFRTPGGPKKFSVYVKNDKGNIVKVNFGDPNMSIKRDDPESRKSFRARHNCDNPGPKWKAKYWSCKFWSSKKVSDLT